MADGTLFGRVRGPLVVDLFAGGGGASLGIQQALGVSPVVAVNHCRHAIAMHAQNHPETEHFHASVFDVAPLTVARGRRVDLLWASPDCTHFSRAKGGRPRETGRRALAWVVVDWARDVRPRCIALENVPEFVTWGPLDEEGHPIRERAGETFRAFVAALDELGYRVEHRVLNAADYGAPTSRRRLFLVARCDGQPLRWPEPTHGPGRALPWRTAAECIDWSLPIPSIFERARPLAEATQRRIAEGIRRYVLGAREPFLLCLTHGGRLEPVSGLLRTTTTANRGERAVVVPSLLRFHGERRPGESPRHADIGGPLPTQTVEPRFGLAAAFLTNTRNGEREGQSPRVRGLDQSAWTVTGAGSQGALCAAFLAKHYGGPGGHPTPGQPAGAPLGAVTGKGQLGPVVAWLDKLHGSARAGVPLDTPHPTVAGGGGRGGGHAALVAAFLARYYGSGGQWAGLDEPLHAATTKARFGLVTVTLGGEEYVVTDIGMRMLQPRELARAQGFPDSYVLTGTKSEQIARIGNSVCPPVARAIAAALVGDGR